MKLDDSQIRRLAFIKFLRMHALEMLKQPEPMACASLLLIHDAAELFLGLASEVWDARPKDDSFLNYWPALDAKLSPNSVTKREGMSKLNKARVGLKHHGNMPSRLSLETYAKTFQDFLDENAQALFGLSLDDISMTDLVYPETARIEIKNAEHAIVTEKFRDAARCAAIAFRLIIDNYERSKRDPFGRSLFSMGANLAPVQGRRLIDHSAPIVVGSTRNRAPSSRLDLSKLIKFMDSITSTVQDLQSAMRIIVLGIDFRKYTRFRNLTPIVYLMLDNDYRASEVQSTNQVGLTRDECQFCIDFVVETSLRLRECDYSTLRMPIGPEGAQ